MQLSDITAAQLLKHVRVLSEEFPHRHTGDPQERQAVDYIANQMREAGLDVEVLEIPVMGWEVVGGPTLEFTGPEGRQVECAPFIFSGSTPEDGLEGRVQYVGRSFIAGGFEWDKYALVDDEGKCKALLVGRDDGPAIAQAGPPSGLAGTAETPLITWPACVFGSEDLRYVQDWHNAGYEVRARYSVQVRFRPDAHSYIVRGALVGNVDPEDVVILGCHHDCQGALGFPAAVDSPGANDNASAVAIFLELARYYKPKGSAKTLWFISFGGEERNLILSRDYARTLNETGQLNQVIAYLGIDQAANGDVLRLLSSSDEPHLRPRINLRPMLAEAAEQLQLAQRFETWGPAPVHAASDHWPFYFSGVPSFLTGWHPFPTYHRSGDNLSYCNDDSKFLATMHVTAEMIDRVCALPRQGPVAHTITDGHVTTNVAVDARKAGT
jgi:aminopeptidase YwaD